MYLFIYRNNAIIFPGHYRYPDRRYLHISYQFCFSGEGRQSLGTMTPICKKWKRFPSPHYGRWNKMQSLRDLLIDNARGLELAELGFEARDSRDGARNTQTQIPPAAWEVGSRDGYRTGRLTSVEHSCVMVTALSTLPGPPGLVVQLSVEVKASVTRRAPGCFSDRVADLNHLEGMWKHRWLSPPLPPHRFPFKGRGWSSAFCSGAVTEFVGIFWNQRTSVLAGISVFSGLALPPLHPSVVISSRSGCRRITPAKLTPLGGSPTDAPLLGVLSLPQGIPGDPRKSHLRSSLSPARLPCSLTWPCVWLVLGCLRVMLSSVLIIGSEVTAPLCPQSCSSLSNTPPPLSEEAQREKQVAIWVCLTWASLSPGPFQLLP